MMVSYRDSHAGRMAKNDASSPQAMIIPSRCSRELRIMVAAAALVVLGIAERSSLVAAELGGTRPCPALTDGQAPWHCYRRAAASETRQQPGSRLNGSWRLMRAPNPRGGPDAVSIVHTADISRSDADLAGLMLRCAEGDVEALIIVFQPRPPNARPWIKLGPAGGEAKFEAMIALPFTALLLPPEATALLTGRWRSSDEIAVEIESDPTPVHGIVSLAGLGPSLAELRASCPSQ
jgi:hypothetical protein